VFEVEIKDETIPLLAVEDSCYKILTPTIIQTEWISMIVCEWEEEIFGLEKGGLTSRV
jgi:hypothetical protein